MKETKIKCRQIAAFLLVVVMSLMTWMGASGTVKAEDERKETIESGTVLSGKCEIKEMFLAPSKRSDITGDNHWFHVAFQDENIKQTMDLECYDVNAKDPTNLTADYTFTVKSVNLEKKIMTGTMSVTPPDATDGVTYGDDGKLVGNQHLGMESISLPYPVDTVYSENNISTENSSDSESEKIENEINVEDYKKMTQMLKNAGCGLAKKDANGISIASVGETVITASIRTNSGIDVVNYDSNGYTILKNWHEGILTGDGRQMYCCELRQSFQPGEKTGVDATKYYNQATINTIAALLYYFDTNKCTGLSNEDSYMIRQCAVWNILNEVNGWYTPSSNDASIAIEYGNGVKDSAGHFIADHVAGLLYYEGITWATDPKNLAAINGTGIIYEGEGQDLSEWNYDYQPKGKLNLIKSSANRDLTDNHPLYSLKGAVYGVYSDSECKNKVGELTTQENGQTNQLELNAGTYYVKETNAPAGYTLNPNVDTVTIKNGENATVELQDTAAYDPVELQVEKIDQEVANVAAASSQGMAELEHTEFTICYYAGNYTENNLPEKATKKWVVETKKESSSGKTQFLCKLDQEHKVSGDEFYIVDGNVVLPLGTISIEETKSPKGYLLENSYMLINQQKVQGKKIVTQIQQNGNSASLTSGNVYQAADQVIRGDIEFVKADEFTQKRMAEIPFLITSTTTGESHQVMTDENGFFSSASSYNKHSKNTNQGTEESGTWFGCNANGENVPVNDEEGAFPYDVYKLEELPCKANEGKILFQGQFVISRDGYTVKYGTIDNHDLKIATSAVDEKSSTSNVDAEKEVTICDTVYYTGLEKCAEYVLRGTLMDKKTKEPVLNIDGKAVTGECTFTAMNTEGSEIVTFTLDAIGMEGKDVVVFEEILQNENVIAEHKDFEAMEQTVHVNELIPEELDEPEKPVQFTPVVEEKAAKTGDSTNVDWLGIICAAAMTGVILIFRLKGNRR